MTGIEDNSIASARMDAYLRATEHEETDHPLTVGDMLLSIITPRSYINRITCKVAFVDYHGTELFFATIEEQYAYSDPDRERIVIMRSGASLEQAIYRAYDLFIKRIAELE